jgi:hypothetical protein
LIVPSTSKTLALGLAGFIIKLAVLAGFFAAGDKASAAPSCEAAIADRLEPVSVKAVTDGGDIGLADGRILRLAGLRWPDTADLLARRQWAGDLDALLKEGLAEAAIGAKPDRWQRFPALVMIRDASGKAELLQERLTSSGNGLFWPEPGLEEPCRMALIEAERQARLKGTGLWKTQTVLLMPQDFPLDPQRFGRLALVEGRITNIVQRRSVTYINLGLAWRGKLTVLTFNRRGLAVADLATLQENVKGKWVTLRGILEKGRRNAEIIVSMKEQITVEAQRE